MFILDKAEVLTRLLWTKDDGSVTPANSIVTSLCMLHCLLVSSCLIYSRKKSSARDTPAACEQLLFESVVEFTLDWDSSHAEVSVF